MCLARRVMCRVNTATLSQHCVITHIPAKCLKSTLECRGAAACPAIAHSWGGGLATSRCRSKAVTLTHKSLTSPRISSKSCTTSWRVEGTPACDAGTARSAPYCSSIATYSPCLHHHLTTTLSASSMLLADSIPSSAKNKGAPWLATMSQWVLGEPLLLTCCMSPLCGKTPQILHSPSSRGRGSPATTGRTKGSGSM
ncbi:uncharacterized protein LOC123509854 [Portunus trituberculatus]|uniref:uncharacterized protein LOC123509854 n=1 Tax=Portunus trituberculatus TaxID=210409 RepID=UPI001E1CDE39|nr:uncharacterized protein LOC123509854 [Portunus trituberculatus]